MGQLNKKMLISILIRVCTNTAVTWTLAVVKSTVKILTP